MGKTKLILLFFILASLASFGQGSKHYSVYQKGLEIADSTFKMRDTIGGSDSATWRIYGGDLHIGGSIDSVVFDVPTNITSSGGTTSTDSFPTQGTG